MSTEGKRVRYTEFITSLSILKGSVHMNSYWLEKSEVRVLLLHSYLEIRFEHITSF